MNRLQFATQLFELAERIDSLETQYANIKSDIRLKKSNDKHRIFDSLLDLQTTSYSLLRDLNSAKCDFDTLAGSCIKFDFK